LKKAMKMIKKLKNARWKKVKCLKTEI